MLTWQLSHKMYKFVSYEAAIKISINKVKVQCIK